MSVYLTLHTRRQHIIQKARIALLTRIAPQYGLYPLEKLGALLAGAKFEPYGPVSGHNRLLDYSSLPDLIGRHLLIEYYGRIDLAHCEAPIKDGLTPEPSFRGGKFTVKPVSAWVGSSERPMTSMKGLRMLAGNPSAGNTRKQITTSCLALDHRRLARERRLPPTHGYKWGWKDVRGTLQGTVGIFVRPDSLNLSTAWMLNHRTK